MRDEHTERLETWVDEIVADLFPHHARVIVPYAHWKVLRTVRRRTRRKHTTVGVADSARERIRTAVRLLDHLDRKGKVVDAHTQSTLDSWVDGNPSRASDVAPFIRWLNARNVTRNLHVETAMAAYPSEVSSEQLHRALIRELVSGHTPTSDLATRVAGLLILLYGARVERIHRLTTADVTTKGRRTYLTLSTDPIEIPPAVAQLINELAAAAERSPRALTRTGEACYLFASPRRHHQPIHPTTLGRKLASAGVHPQVARNHAMLALASDLPAAVVATQMGLTSQTMTRWGQFSQRDGTAYILARAAGAKS